MNSAPNPRWAVGRGRGNPTLEFWEDRPGRAPGMSQVRRDPASNNFKLFVKSIPAKMNKEAFYNIFAKCGLPLNIYIHPPKGPHSTTWGFVEYQEYEEAHTAVRCLNNNLLLDIEVQFARERHADTEYDPILKYLTSEEPAEDMMMHESSMETFNEPRTFTKLQMTVKNDSPLTGKLPIEDFHKPVFDATTQKNIEEALFHRILDLYKKGEGSTAKCNICNVSCSLACSSCTAIFYCSEQCQSKDWPTHSQTCKGLIEGAPQDSFHARGGGDQTNGYGSSNRERDARPDRQGKGFFDRSDPQPNKFSDRSNPQSQPNRFPDRGNNRGFNRDNPQRDNQNNSGFGKRSIMDNQNNSGFGKRSIMEERRAKMAASNRPTESEGFQNNQNNRFGQNNLKSQYAGRDANKAANNVQDDEDWGSNNKDNDAKDSSATTPGLEFIDKEKAFLQEIEVKKEVETKVGIKQEVEQGTTIIPVQTTSKVTIYHAEDCGLFWVQKADEENKSASLCQQLNEFLSKSSTPFSPIKDAICGIKYEGTWYRCQVTSMDPLIVHYTDFGYPETVTSDRLFELPSDLKSLPPLAFKIKLADGTPEQHLNKLEGDSLEVKLVEKVEDYWLALIVEENSTPAAVIPQPAIKVEAPADAVSPPVVQPTPAVVPTTPAAVPPTTAAVAPAVIAKSPARSVEDSAEPAKSDQIAVVQQPYPAMLDASKFTTVVVTYVADSKDHDTYYVGAPNVWDAMCEMCSHFKSVYQNCGILTPKHGSKGITIYMESWYRVKVVSVAPEILVHFIDYGNEEPVKPEDLRTCPETHKDVPPLVHRIRLAPGTDNKFFNLPESSELSVKPVSWLADSTVLVEVEGSAITEKTNEGPSENLITPATTSASSPATPMSDAPQHTNSIVSVSTESQQSPPSNQESPPTNQIASNPVVSGIQPITVPPTPTAVQNDMIPSRPVGTVDLLEENWKVSFIPSKVDLVKNSLVGLVYCEQIPETLSFVATNEAFQEFLSSQTFDPNFKPNIGEIVGFCLPSGEWERGTVLLQEGLLAFTDNGGVTRCFKPFKLTEAFVNIPSMAGMFTLCKEDPDLLSRLVDEDEIIFDVVSVASSNGRAVVSVTNASLKGELRSWCYEPLETPNPLNQGESVALTRVLDSNTFLVSPANDLAIEGTIQINCKQSTEKFKCPPKEGDYVSYLDKESNGYFRCRIDKLEGDACMIFDVDSATNHKVNLSDLHPLPASVRNVPCRISQIELKDVDKITLTEQAQVYLSHIAEEEKSLVIDIDESGKATVTVEGEEVTLNNKLNMLLKPKIEPNSEGKLTIMDLPELGVPLNQEFGFLVTQAEPLYVQLVNSSVKYFSELHPLLQEHCAKDSALYNPCQGELCLALFEGEWYRARCLKETNTGISVLMLVDFGNIFNAQTSNIRKILPEMVSLPSVAISCKVHGLPDIVSPALKSRLDEILAIENNLSGVFVAEKDGCYEVAIESVNKALKELQ